MRTISAHLQRLLQPVLKIVVKPIVPLVQTMDPELIVVPIILVTHLVMV